MPMVVMPVRTGHLPHDERRAARGAARLAVVIGEQHALLADAVDVGRAAHHAVRVGADIPHADVVAQDDQDVGFLRFRREYGGECRRGDGRSSEQAVKVLAGICRRAGTRRPTRTVCRPARRAQRTPIPPRWGAACRPISHKQRHPPRKPARQDDSSRSFRSLPGPSGCRQFAPGTQRQKFCINVRSTGPLLGVKTSEPGCNISGAGLGVPGGNCFRNSSQSTDRSAVVT